MTTTADCRNTQSLLGRNATPLEPIAAAHKVLGGIELDMASDSVINREVKAQRIYTFEDDGFQQDIKAKTVWLNPPGSTITGGTLDQRLLHRTYLDTPQADRKRLFPGYKPAKGVKSIDAVLWVRKLYQHWMDGDVEDAIILCYRLGSLSGFGQSILSHPICITAAGAGSPAISGTGRLSFQLINQGQRVSQPSNTQGSAFVLLSRSDEKRRLFKECFSEFGIVK
jgi:hypothetical protein